MPFTTGDNNFGVAKWIVNATAGLGTHTTIATALTSASSGDTIFIMPGTYTENLTLKAGVNLTAFGSDSSLNNTGKVNITGKATFTAAGSVSIFGIELQTNSDFFLAVTGSAASIVNLNNCYLNCVNNTGISFTTSSGSAVINIKDCNGDVGTTGIALFSSSSAGKITFLDCDFSNTGASSTASTISAGTFSSRRSGFSNPLTTSSTASASATYSQWDTSAQNATSSTYGGSGNHSFYFCFYSSGSASSVSMSNTSVLSYCSIGSTNTNAITGAGTVQYYALAFTSSSSLINTTTQSGGLLQGGLSQAPSAGFIGEQIRGFASGVSISNNSPTTITSINLTAGIWDISAVGQLVNSGTTTAQVVGIATATNSTTGFVDGDNKAQLNAALASPTFQSGIPSYRVTLTASATYYLIGFSLFSTGSCTGVGRISGTRVG